MTMSEKNRKTMDKLVGIIERRGFVGDKYGNYKNTVAGSECRYKFNPMSYRYEKKVGGSWIRVTGSYYKDVKFPEE